MKASVKVKIFYSSLEGLIAKYERVIGRHNEKVLFVTYKPGDIKSLESRLEDMLTPPEQHMKDIVAELSRKRTASTFKRCIEEYLRQQIL